MTLAKNKGVCPVCRCYRGLTEISGQRVIKLHKRYDKTCAGSLKPPAAKERPGAAWKTVRASTLDRDGQRCRKCLASSGLEAHHIVERVYGGKDDLANLITLCGPCHDEWTYVQPPPEAMTFEQWLGVPPARYLVAVFAKDWPTDMSAADYKATVLAIMALARSDYEKGRR